MMPQVSDSLQLVCFLLSFSVIETNLIYCSSLSEGD